MFLCSPADSQISQEGNGQLTFVLQLMNHGNYDLALLELERFTFLFPQSSSLDRVRLLKGVCHLEAGRYEKAGDHFDKVMETAKDPGISKRAMLFMAESFFRQGRLKDAEYYFSVVAEDCSEPALRQAALYRLGWTRMKANDWKEASRLLLSVEGEGILPQSAKEISPLVMKGDELPLKDPSTAGFLAGVLPGLGHAYVGRYRDAAAAFTVNALFVWATFEAFDKDHVVLAGILGFLELGWYAGNIYSAVNSAHKHNRRLQEEFRGHFMDRLQIVPLLSDRGAIGLSLSLRY
jgi:outer membrane protein assembly factor BamD (BamD/ComL family)